ncbi:hypothetical protein GCM10010451_17470 [Streptomyces virens]|uniref:Uncharacterized protein n=1 Tax=Streptomyces virens TaxID=285572 RepID=A0ABP6P6X1_9ACTN|nr:hypothetical protein GCM10010247_57300 [Streptomyces calvus]
MTARPIGSADRGDPSGCGDPGGPRRRVTALLRAGGAHVAAEDTTSRVRKTPVNSHEPDVRNTPARE